MKFCANKWVVAVLPAFRHSRHAQAGKRRSIAADEVRQGLRIAPLGRRPMTVAAIMRAVGDGQQHLRAGEAIAPKQRSDHHANHQRAEDRAHSGHILR
jgi:hypothetical protein